MNHAITRVYATLTQQPQELTHVGVIRQFFGSRDEIIRSVFTYALASFSTVGNDQRGFLLTMTLLRGIRPFLILNTFIHIRERFTQEKTSHQPLKVVAKIRDDNVPWHDVSLIIFTYWLLTAIKNHSTVYYFKYTLHDQGLVSWANSFTFSRLTTVLLILIIRGRYGNKHTNGLGMIIGLTTQLVMAGGV